MSEDHVTLRISKKALVAALALLIPAAFAAGLAIGGRDADPVAAPLTSTTLAPTAIPETTTTTVATSVVAQKAPTTTVKKKKKVVATTTTTTLPPKPSVSATYSDNCPEPGVNNLKAGVITLKWTSANVVKVDVKVTQGRVVVYSKFNTTLNGDAQINSICNNAVDAAGKFTGQPLTVIYQVTGYLADGSPVGFTGEDKM